MKVLLIDMDDSLTIKFGFHGFFQLGFKFAYSI